MVDVFRVKWRWNFEFEKVAAEKESRFGLRDCAMVRGVPSRGNCGHVRSSSRTLGNTCFQRHKAYLLEADRLERNERSLDEIRG